MAAAPVIITEEAFLALVNSGRRPAEILQPNAPGHQLIVGWRHRENGEDTDLVVKVYSSVFGPQGRGRSRGVGKDSIRVCLVDIRTMRGVGKTCYTQRTAGWERRLIEKIRAMFARAQDEMARRRRAAA